MLTFMRWLCALLLPLPLWVRADCVLRQECSPGSAGCYPRATTPAERAPFALNSTGIPFACPQYTDSGCCTPAANSQLFLSYIIEENSLGEPASGGCPACSANVQGLWCAFACAPTQSDYVAVEGLHNVSGVGQVFEVNVTLSDAYAAALFESCAGVGLVRMNPLMDTAPLFLRYMGLQGVSTANTLVQFQMGGAAGLALQAYDCCNFPANVSDPGAAGNASCPCASCLGNCPNGSCSPPPSGSLSVEF